MPEMILPGTYIKVRDEGLIAPGPFSVGNLGIVGSAAMGKAANLPREADAAAPVYTPANLGEAREVFGLYDPYTSPAGDRELTLIRALELAYANGAQRVFAVRVVGSGASTAKYLFGEAPNALTLESVAPGDGYNGATLTTGLRSDLLELRIEKSDGTALETFVDLPTKLEDFVKKLEKARFFTATSSATPTGSLEPQMLPTPATTGAEVRAKFFAKAGTTAEKGLSFIGKEGGPKFNGASIKIEDGATAAECKVTIKDDNGTTHVTEVWEKVSRTPAQFIEILNGANTGYDYTANLKVNGTAAAGKVASTVFEVATEGADGNVENGDAVKKVDGVEAKAATFTLKGEGTATVTLTAKVNGAGPDGWKIKLYRTVTVVFQTQNGVIESWRRVPVDLNAFAEVINGKAKDYDYTGLSTTGGESKLFKAAAPSAGGDIPPPADNANPAVVTATQLQSGTNGASPQADAYKVGLSALLDSDVQIVVLPGQGDDDSGIAAALNEHLTQASDDLIKRERIGLIGRRSSQAVPSTAPLDNQEGRLIFVGPGVKAFDAAAQREVALPGAYAAAAVAGLISRLDPQESPTNKVLSVGGVEKVFNGTQLEQLVLKRVLGLEDRAGVRVVRGITTSSNTAWTQITTRRIVDFARVGTRAAADSFIGKLNNDRVRQALKASINGLLTDMVDREMLISYELDVSATREQQIRGIVSVTMILRPTFSIDYIRVVMFLQ